MPDAEPSQSPWTPRSLSVVVPVFDEAPNVRPLIEGIREHARRLALPFEIVLVDDGSRDDTLAQARELLASTPELIVIALRRNFGQTLALQAGLDRARGDAVVTMDGDLQNDPADIPRLLEALSEGADVVSGWRRTRRDTLLLRRVPSWLANRLIRGVTGVSVHDQGCSLKAYRGEVIRALDLYAEMHRFIAVLTLPLGAKLAEVEVNHHARVAGLSKYGISRTFSVVADLFTIKMLTSFRDAPLRWFALLGAPFFALALLTGVSSLLSNAASVTLATLTLTTAMTGLTCLLLGLLGEAITATYDAPRARTTLHREWRA